MKSHRLIADAFGSISFVSISDAAKAAAGVRIVAKEFAGVFAQMGMR